MATILYLNDTQVYPDGNQSIKLTRENPYFTHSESYTLDVVLPMDILDNRQFFQNIQRIDRTKRPPVMTCRLVVDHAPVLCGSAKVTQVTERQVKVQLLGGRSEMNFLSTENKDYIDTLPLGTLNVTGGTVDTGIRAAVSPVNDETRGGMASTYQFCLVDLARQIITHYGYTITSCDIDVLPWNRIYVASALQTKQASHVLPHWSPRDFFTEFCNFFNVSLDIDNEQKTVAIVSNTTFFTTRRHIEIDPVDEYTAEIGDDAHALAADNISFELSGSEGHDYDCIADNLRTLSATQEYATRTEALQAYEAMTEAARKKKIFKCPIGKFTAWEHDYSDWGEEPRTLFTQIDVLAPLTRAADAGETKLKICPAAIVMGEYESGFGGSGSSTPHTRTARLFLPSVQNPTPNDTYIYISEGGGIFVGPRQEAGEQGDDGVTIQELATGEAEIRDQEGKEDLLQVIFIDDVAQTYSRVDSLQPDTYTQLTRIVGFTDHQYKKSHRGSAHRPWSLALNPTGADYYLGQLHQNGFSFNMKARHTFRFIADRMPDPRDIFIVHGKRFACEKMEANVDAKGFDRLMTGYFYEMTD